MSYIRSHKLLDLPYGHKKTLGANLENNQRDTSCFQIDISTLNPQKHVIPVGRPYKHRNNERTWSDLSESMCLSLEMCMD